MKAQESFRKWNYPKWCVMLLIRKNHCVKSKRALRACVKQCLLQQIEVGNVPSKWLNFKQSTASNSKQSDKILKRFPSHLNKYNLTNSLWIALKHTCEIKQSHSQLHLFITVYLKSLQRKKCEPLKLIATSLRLFQHSAKSLQKCVKAFKSTIKKSQSILQEAFMAIWPWRVPVFGEWKWMRSTGWKWIRSHWEINGS